MIQKILIKILGMFEITLLEILEILGTFLIDFCEFLRSKFLIIQNFELLKFLNFCNFWKFKKFLKFRNLLEILDNAISILIIINFFIDFY